MSSEGVKAGLPPGPAYPRPVQTLAWFSRPTGLMQRCRARFGDIFTLRVAHEGTWVFLSDPDAVKQVFRGDPSLLHAGEANVALLPVVGSQSVLLLDGPAHMSQRKLMLPPFHGARMQRYGEVMADVASREIETWPVDEPFAIWPRMQAVTLEVIMRTVFGIREADRLDRLRGLLRGLLDWTTDSRRVLVFMLLGPRRLEAFGPFRRAREPVDELLLDEIRRRRGDPAVAERDDVLSLLVQARHEDGRPMTDTELRDELMTLLIAGHETTATALSWAIERLVRHPEKLARLSEEVAAGEDGYLDAVIQETLRLRPVLPIVVRRLTQPMELGGYLIPAGVSVAPCIYLIHHRPDIYPDPHSFVPERFCDTSPGTYSWIPFGGGVRRCLGASFAQFEMKTVLSTLLENRHLRAADPLGEPIKRRAVTLTPRRGARVIAGTERANGRGASSLHVPA